jgi:hypothetical protein
VTEPCRWPVGHRQGRSRCGLGATAEVRAGSRCVVVCPLHRALATAKGWTASA